MTKRSMSMMRKPLLHTGTMPDRAAPVETLSPDEVQKDKIHLVEVDHVTPDPKQSRKYFNYESLEQLSRSILQKGMLQPVILRKGPNGEFQLAAGERRLRAAKMAGLTKIPAVLTTDRTMEISLIENLQRENLRPLEEAEALAGMAKECSYTLEQMSQALNKAKSTLSETLSLNRLPDAIKEELWRSDAYSRRLLVEIAKQETPAKMLSLFKRVKDKNLKSGQVRELCRRDKNGRSRTDHNIQDEVSELTDHLKAMDGQQIVALANDLKRLKAIIEEVIGT